MGEDRSASAVFGRQLKALRDRRGLTLADVSRRLEGIGAGASPPYLSRLEREQRGVSLDMALAICRALDVALVDLLAADEDEDVQVGHDTLAPDVVGNLVGGGPLSVEQQLLINIAVQCGIDRALLALAERARQPHDLLRDLHGIREHGLPDVPLDDESEQ